VEQVGMKKKFPKKKELAKRKILELLFPNWKQTTHSTSVKLLQSNLKSKPWNQHWLLMFRLNKLPK
jgi:hypothetical protein